MSRWGTGAARSGAAAWLAPGSGTSRVRRVWLGTACAMVLACTSTPRTAVRAPEPVAENAAWDGTLAAAREAASDGHFGTADAILSRYAMANPDAPAAHESDFWRALLLLDPRNPLGSSAARDLLTRYLESPGRHRAEARVLLQLAAERDTMRTQLALLDTAAHTAPMDSSAPTPREAALQKENQALKDQLEKTMAELDRIKKRLAAPKP